MHLSLDGFVAGPNGEMNRIKVDEVPKGCSEGVLRTFGKIFDHVGKHISEGDTALYGRVTYQMMESYPPQKIY